MKKIIGIFIMMLLIVTTFLPLLNSADKNDIIWPSNEEYYDDYLCGSKNGIEIELIKMSSSYNGPPDLKITSVPDYFNWKDFGGQDWTTPAKNQHYPNNCGSCFILETTGEKNNEGVTIEAGKKIGVIVTDNCEASNPANQKWCIPYKNGKVVPSSFSQQEDKTYKLNIEGCSMQDFENGTCTNGAGYGYHFDVQIAPSSTSEIGNRKNFTLGRRMTYTDWD